MKSICLLVLYFVEVSPLTKSNVAMLDYVRCSVGTNTMCEVFKYFPKYSTKFGI